MALLQNNELFYLNEAGTANLLGVEIVVPSGFQLLAA